MELPQSMGKLMHPVGELDLKSLFHDKSWFSPMWSLPSPVPLLFPKQRKVGSTLVKFMGAVLGGYAGQISRWTQHCRRQASDMCQADPLSWATLPRSLAVFGGSQVDRCWDARQGCEARAADSLRLMAMELRLLGFWWIRLCDPFLLKAKTLWSAKPWERNAEPRLWTLRQWQLRCWTVWEGAIKHQHRCSMRFWKSLKMKILECCDELRERLAHGPWPICLALFVEMPSFLFFLFFFDGTGRKGFRFLS